MSGRAGAGEGDQPAQWSSVRRSTSVPDFGMDDYTGVLRAMWAQQHQDEQKRKDERAATGVYSSSDDDDDDEDEEDASDDEGEGESDEDEDEDEEVETEQVAAVKTEPGVETNQARYRRELEERYSAELARLLLAPYGDPALAGPRGAFSAQSPGLMGYGAAPAAPQPSRRPSGFLPVYTGAEVRHPDRPSYGWSQQAWPIPPMKDRRSYGWMPGVGASTVPPWRSYRSCPQEEEEEDDAGCE
jgi:hypothetical protein